ncbi:transposase [Brevibacillus fortis]|uniref:transposase n=1 Tax=Brevibacillus fortis TaxID=2126352 RepID=UPI0038FCCB6E
MPMIPVTIDSAVPTMNSPKASNLEKVKTALGKLPGTVIADAGYGGEENYAYLESEQLEALVKYSTNHKEKSKAWTRDIMRYRHYRSTNCEGCPLKSSCTRAVGNREVKVSLRYLRLSNRYGKNDIVRKATRFPFDV